MKVVFNRKLLCAVFPPLMCAVSNKSTLSAIEGVLIEVSEDNYCILTTYDTDKGIRLRVDAKVFAPGSYIVNAQRFFQVARAMDGDEIEITVDAKLTAKLSAAGRHIRCRRSMARIFRHSRKLPMKRVLLSAPC